MRKDLQQIKNMLEQGAQDVAARQLNTNNSKGIGIRNLGNEHVSTSIFLHFDPILEPVDKEVYTAIKILSPQTFNTEIATYPTYDEICKFVNVSSHTTIARALAILRVTRWLISKQVRTSNGTAANVYMTMDNPMDVADILPIDESYFTYLAKSTKHAHKRVRNVSLAMLTQYENDTLSGKDMTVASHPIEQILDATEFLKGNDGSYFGMDRGLIDELKGSRYERKSDTLPSSDNEELDIEGSSYNGENKSETEKNKNLSKSPSSYNEENKKSTQYGSSYNEEGDLAHSSNNEEPCSGSSSLKITTTAKTNSNVFYANVEPDKKLLKTIKSWLSTLDNSQHFRIGRLLMRINDCDREPMVYQLSNRIKYGSTPVRSPIGYVGKLCGMLKRGDDPFTEFASKHYTESKTKPKQDPKRVSQKELIDLNVEAREAWTDLEAQKINNKKSPSEFNQKAVERADKKLRNILEKIKQLEEMMEQARPASEM